MKKKKATINPKNEDDKCFHHAATVGLNHEEIKRDLQRISKIKPFINKYNWNRTKYPSKIDVKNPTIALNICILMKKKYTLLIFQNNTTREKQILLMIPNEEKEGLRYLAVKKLSALLHRITSRNKADFYCLNCFHSIRIENKLKSYEKVCKNIDFCEIVMPSEKDNALESNQYMKSDKMSDIIYADIESLIKKQMDEQTIQKILY